MLHGPSPKKGALFTNKAIAEGAVMRPRCLVVPVFIILTALFWSGFAPEARSADESPITTGLSDALYGIPFIDDFSPKHYVALDAAPRGSDGGYLLGPGIYSGVILSYCLNSGAYAPYKGDGYLYAPLKGSKAEVVRKILKRSTLHPQIPQNEIQTILWSFLDRVPIAEFPRNRQCYLTELLSEEELRSIDGSSIDYELLKKECVAITEASPPPQNITSSEEAMRAYRSGAYFSPEDQRRFEEMLESNVEKGLVPRETLEMFRRSMEFQKLAADPNGLDEQKLKELQDKANEMTESAKRWEQQLRGMLTSLTAKYEEIERVAVLFGRPRDDKKIQEIPKKRWSYHPDGFYIRFDPNGYSETTVEVYVPERLDVTRDEKGRITSVKDEIGNCVKMAYDDSREPLKVSGEPNLIGYPMNSIVFDYVHPQEPMKRLHLQWQTSAWTFVGVPAKKGRLANDPGNYADAKRRYENICKVKSEIDSLDSQFKPTSPINGVVDLASLAMALEQAYGDLPAATLAEALGVPAKGAFSFGHYGHLLRPEIIPGMCMWYRFPAVDLVKRQWLYEVSLRESSSDTDRAASESSSEAVKGTETSPPTEVPKPKPTVAKKPSERPGRAKIGFDPSAIVVVPGNSSVQRLGMSVPPKNAATTPPPKDPDKKRKCDQIKALTKLIEELKKIRDLYKEIGKSAKDWYELEKGVEDAFKKWLSERYPGEYPAGKTPKTATFGAANPCEGTMKAVPDVCSPPYNYPFPQCYYMNAAAVAHEETHISDVAKSPTDKDTFCSEDKSLAKEQVDIAVKWEQNAYGVQIDILQQGLDELKNSLDEPCEL
jgi:hypothetical protein